MARERIGEAAVRWSYNAGAKVLGALGLKELVRRHVLPRLVGVLQSTETPGAYAAADRYIEDEIERVVRKPGPIIVGPFLSEVGFELLYWIPLLRWIKDKWQFDPERLVVVSRGGTALWYEGLSGRYLDVFDFTSPERFAARSAARWESEQRQKQFVPRSEDEEIIAWARQRCGAANAEVLHPSLMYRLFGPVFQGQLPIDAMLKRVRYERFRQARPASRAREQTAARLCRDPLLFQTVLSRHAEQPRIRQRFGGAHRKDDAGRSAQHRDRGRRSCRLPCQRCVEPRELRHSPPTISTFRAGLSPMRAPSSEPMAASLISHPSLACRRLPSTLDDRDLKPAHLEAIRAACRAIGGRFVELHVDDVDLLGRAGIASVST